MNGSAPIGKKPRVGVQADLQPVKPALTAQTEAVVSEEQVKRQGANVGVKPYTAPSGPPPSRGDLRAIQMAATQLADVALAYAKVGKFELAKRRLADAHEKLGQLEIRTKPVELTGRDVHVGMWKNQGAGQGDTQAILLATARHLSKAEREVSSLAAKGVAPVNKEPERKKTVMLFGLSANPPTGMGGHAGIVEWGGKRLRADIPNDAEPAKARENVPMDEVWVLPVFKHAFASKSGLLPFEHRQAMARLAFENLPGLEGKVKVQDAEKRAIEAAFAEAQVKGTPPEQVKVGTIDVVRRLMDEHPDTQFVLALGGDTFSDLKAGKWKEGDTLQKLIPIVVIPRKGVDGVQASEQGAPQLSDISSTKVRGSSDLDFLKTALHPDVLAYIIANKLYSFGEGTPGGNNP